MFGNRRSRSTILVCLWTSLFALLVTSSVHADPGFPLRRMPICGDQDGSEIPLVFNCVEFVHVPDVQTYVVPGSGPFTFKADFIYREATYNNELGFYLVDDNGGAVGELEPGDAGYMAAALSRAQIIFPSGSTASVADYGTELQGGQILVFFIVQNNSLANLRTNNPNNQLGRSPIAFFSLDFLNPDGRDHFVGFTRASGGLTQFGFEDLTNGGDNDYDDVSYNIDSPIAPQPEAGLLSLPFIHEEGDTGLPHVWSFFDHQYPLSKAEPGSNNGSIMKFTGEVLGGTLNACNPGASCYSGHSGTDFSYGLPSGSAVLAAADGIVTSDTKTCEGNLVHIDHGEYQTAYYHLQDDEHWVKSGEVKAGDRIGTVGNTGTCTTGAHLHFAVYYDQNGDDVFAWPDELVDPFGWRDQCTAAATDPWTIRFQDSNKLFHTGARSRWLWNFSQPSCVALAANAAYSFFTPDGVLVAVPQGAITTPVTLSISAAPEPGQGTGSLGFLQLQQSPLSVLDTIPVVDALQLSALRADGRPLDGFAQPVAVRIPYTEADLVYGNESALSVYQLEVPSGNWSLVPADINTSTNRATALIDSPGVLSLRSEPAHLPPTVTAIAPAGAVNTSETTMTIHGQNFLNTPTVNLGESSLEVVSATATQLMVVVPARMTPGDYDLVVRNPDGQTAISQNAFEIRGFAFIPGIVR
jgi:murein DD-endopeptidase MepM/ murein hydrolase activator NlpD